MGVRRAGHREHVVQRHGHVGDHDLQQGGAEALALQAQLLRRRPLAVLDLHGQLQLALGLGLIVRRLFAQFAPHLPAHPQQQEAARQQQADDGQKLDRDQGEADAHQDGGGQTDQDGLAALFGRQGGGGQTHGHGVVARQHEVDHQHLTEGGQGGGSEEFGEIHGRALGQGGAFTQAVAARQVPRRGRVAS